jgi:hypothetical protein
MPTISSSLASKIRIRAERKGANPMRLQMRSNQNLVHGAARQPQVLGERSYTPAAVVLRLLAGSGLHPRHHFLAIFYRSTGTRGILETLVVNLWAIPRYGIAAQTFVGKTTAPFADRHFRHPELASDLLIALAGSGRQNNPTSLHETLAS